MQINLIILIALTVAALWTVMTRSLLRSAIGLALTSVILTIMIFRLSSPQAAVFELSVCAGLISVLFISTISLTEALTPQQKIQHMKDRLSRFWYLPFIIVIGGIVLSLLSVKINLQLPAPQAQTDVRQVIWNVRQLDLLGQIIILLSGVFGVVIFFKQKAKHE